MPPQPVSRAGTGQHLTLFVGDNHLIELRLIELDAVPLET
jgi:hypothetical protein